MIKVLEDYLRMHGVTGERTVVKALVVSDAAYSEIRDHLFGTARFDAAGPMRFDGFLINGYTILRERDVKKGRMAP
jgi:hypothetical protein